RAFEVYVHGIAVDDDVLCLLSNLESRVHAQRGVRVNHQTSLLVGLKSVGFDLYVIFADRQFCKVIEPLRVRGGLRLHAGLHFRNAYRSTHDRRPAGIKNHTGYAAVNAGKNRDCSERTNYESNPQKLAEETHRHPPDDEFATRAPHCRLFSLCENKLHKFKTPLKRFNTAEILVCQSLSAVRRTRCFGWQELKTKLPSPD